VADSEAITTVTIKEVSITNLSTMDLESSIIINKAGGIKEATINSSHVLTKIMGTRQDSKDK
jgi:hypothetical protein